MRSFWDLRMPFGFTSRRFQAATRRLLPVAGLAGLILGLCQPMPAEAASRIKDIADFEGVRENQLVGYGLVVGLNGSGDSLDKAVFTRESLIGMLERMGVNARDVEDRKSTRLKSSH